MSKPSLWMMDYKNEYTPEIMRRVTDAGVTGIWAFDQAVEQHVAPGKYDFRVTVPYVEAAKKAGFTTIYVQSPIGIAPWVPDEWALRNNLGDYSTLRGPFYDENGNPDLSGEVFGHRCTSYWHPEAEEETYNYVAALRAAVEPDAKVVGSVTSCGEYFFPSHYYASDHGINGSPWYYDGYAQDSYEQSEMSRDAWWRQQRKTILLRRLSWYSQRWTMFSDDAPRKAWARGTVDIMDLLKTLNPNTIRFCGMRTLPGTIEQGKHLPVYCGAEGTANVLENTRKIIDQDLPIKGLLCGLMSVGSTPSKAPDDEAYHQIKLAVDAT